MEFVFETQMDFNGYQEINMEKSPIPFMDTSAGC